MLEFQEIDIAKRVVVGFLLTDSRSEAVDTFNQVLSLLNVKVRLESKVGVNGDLTFIWTGGTETDILNAMRAFNLIVDYVPLNEVYSAARDGNLACVISKFSNLLKNELRRAETMQWLDELQDVL